MGAMKNIFIGSIFVIALATVAILANTPHPPSNDSVAKAFNKNKSGYIQLRNMLVADKPIFWVAPGGVQKFGAPTLEMPPIAEMSFDRFQRYRRLLSRLGALSAIKETRQSNSDVCILIWKAGLGDAIHVAVCWLENELHSKPSGGVANQYDYYPLGDHWYVRRDFT